MGKGAHAGLPEQSIDVVIVAFHIGTALQTIVSRNVPAQDTAVLSITRVQAGDAYNVLPASAVIGGTVRAMKPETMALMESNMRRLASSVAAGFGATADVDFRLIFAPTINNSDEMEVLTSAAAGLVGEDRTHRGRPPLMASEDFGFMLERVPGAHILLGNGDSAPCHSPQYDFNDEAIPYGVGLYAAVVEKKLPKLG
jgi:hippurate hydrolase